MCINRIIRDEWVSDGGIWARSTASQSRTKQTRRKTSSNRRGEKKAMTSLKAACSLSVLGGPSLFVLYRRSNASLRELASSVRARCPLQVRCICPAAFSRCRSAWRFSRSAWAFETVFVAFETADGLQDVLEKGFPVWPLRLTLRGRLELPVNVENMVGGTSFVTGAG